MDETWQRLGRGVCSVLLLAMAHQVAPEATDILLIGCLLIAVWQVLGWNLMSRERRARVIAGFKAKKGIPLDQPHKVDAFLKK